MATAVLKKRQRSDYPYILEYRTRWSDNDMYDHMNNSIYNFLCAPLLFPVFFPSLPPITLLNSPSSPHR